MHRNSLIWSYQLFLPESWLELKIYSKEKNLFMILRIRFPTEFKNLKISLPENKYTCIYNGKKTWCRPSSWFTYTRCLLDNINMECFESAVPANFVSYAPTFFHEVLDLARCSENELFLQKSISLPLYMHQTNWVQFEQENIFIDVCKPHSRVKTDSWEGCWNTYNVKISILF